MKRWASAGQGKRFGLRPQGEGKQGGGCAPVPGMGATDPAPKEHELSSGSGEREGEQGSSLGLWLSILCINFD